MFILYQLIQEIQGFTLLKERIGLNNLLKNTATYHVRRHTAVTVKGLSLKVGSNVQPPSASSNAVPSLFVYLGGKLL